MDQPISAAALRRGLSVLNVDRLPGHQEQTYGSVPSVIYREDESGMHGNFLAASYRRICADSGWSARLNKAYSASARVPRSADRWRGELECANSSDALLMNVFCYPGVLCRPRVCALLGTDTGQRPEFGVRAYLAMHRNEIDRTEIDMRLGPLLVEAKLTEGGFGTATRDRVSRYASLEEVFDLEALPWKQNGRGELQGYQLVRGVLAAHAAEATFLLLCDGRRADLREVWFRVLSAIRSYPLRTRMSLLTWQELAVAMPPMLKRFLAGKYGIFAESLPKTSR